VGAASVRFEQAILRDATLGGQELLVTATVKVACVNARTLKPQRLPAALTALLSSEKL
jgi:acyl-CoA thioesterase FadM